MKKLLLASAISSALLLAGCGQTVTETLTVPLKEARESFEKKYLISQLKKFGGNISKTAKFIGMERSALHRKLRLLGVKDLN